MKFLRILKSTLPICSLVMVGCSSKDTAPTVSYDSFNPLTVRATSDIDLPSPAAHVTFVPNTVAPWLGHILIVDDQQKLFRTDGQGNSPERLADLTAQDAYGLYRAEASGVFLTIEADGNLGAYIQSSNENEFSPMIVSQNTPIRGIQFCEGGDPLTGSAALITQEKTLSRFSISDIGPDAVTIAISTPVKTKSVPSHCAVNPDQAITIWPEFGTGPAQRISPDDRVEKISGPAIRPNSQFGPAESFTVISGAESPNRFALHSAGGDFMIEIENGLSIYAPDEIALLAGTDLPFGGTFNSGLVIAATHAPSPRLVLISLDYINREIAELN